MLRRCLALATVAAAFAPAAPAQAVREVPVVILPIAQPGQPVPSTRALQRALRGLQRIMADVSGGRLRVSGAVAPPIRALTGQRRLVEDHARAVRRATERGVRTAGAIPFYVEAERRPAESFGNPAGVQIRGTSWDEPSTYAHELGHALGLDHARAPSQCPRPFRPLGCANHPRNLQEYGDVLDYMGLGGGQLGAYGLAALGLAPVVDAPAGRATTGLRPLDGGRPRLLRLRTARLDYFVDTRRRGNVNQEPRGRMVRGAAISRVRARYAPGKYDILPATERIPATDPEQVCTGTRACLARQIFQPGRTFTVPGAFRLQVRRGERSGAESPGRGSRHTPVRIATRWLDRTPPRLTVAQARIVRPFGGPAQLAFSLRAAATGAGVLRVEVEQDGSVARVAADAVPGLVAGTRGRGEVRVPLVPGAAGARVRLVDAAGNASPSAPVDLGTLPSVPAATVVADPPLGTWDVEAVPLAAGQSVTIDGYADPALAGSTTVDFSVLGTTEGQEIPLRPDGTFTVTWTAPAPGIYAPRVKVPVGRGPDGLLLYDDWEGYLRG